MDEEGVGQELFTCKRLGRFFVLVVDDTAWLREAVPCSLGSPAPGAHCPRASWGTPWRWGAGGRALAACTRTAFSPVDRASPRLHTPEIVSYLSQKNDRQIHIDVLRDVKFSTPHKQQMLFFLLLFLVFSGYIQYHIPNSMDSRLSQRKILKYGRSGLISRALYRII